MPSYPGVAVRPCCAALQSRAAARVQPCSQPSSTLLPAFVTCGGLSCAPLAPCPVQVAEAWERCKAAEEARAEDATAAAAKSAAMRQACGALFAKVGVWGVSGGARGVES